MTIRSLYRVSSSAALILQIKTNKQTKIFKEILVIFLLITTTQATVTNVTCHPPFQNHENERQDLS
jgi:23S rRNA A1618 N6-methylase RlmF